tara:strand:- start:76 stop:489 length:414 start_codon:yes stop_codon:yes gene_type:complete
MKMSQLKMAIREVVREEIRLGLKEILNENKVPKKQPPKDETFSQNPIINEVLNETNKEEWETLGGTKFTSNRMNDLVGGYADLMNGGTQPQQVNPNQRIAELGGNPDKVPEITKNAMTRDYRDLMKAMDKKKQQKTG